MTIADQLTLLNSTKTGIKTALEAKGVVVGTDSFSTYAEKIDSITTGGWQRHKDWLPMQVIAPTESKFVGLLAVFPEGSNYLSFQFGGFFTVNWGDGVQETFAAGAIATHSYVYENIPQSTYCDRGYRQVIVTVVPTNAGGGLGSATLNTPQPYSSNNSFYTWLDVAFKGSAFTNIYLNGQYLLESVEVLNTPVLRAVRMALCSSLNNVNIDMSTLSAVTQMFTSCVSLESVEGMDLRACTSLSGLFSGCSALKKVSFINTSKVVDWSTAFNGCVNLTEIIGLDFSKAGSMGTTFGQCNSLEYLPDMTTLLAAANVNFYASGVGTLPKLREIPAIPVTPTGLPNFSRAPSLSRFRPIGITAAPLYFNNCNFSASGLNEIFTNLGTVTGTKVISVTGNPGTATCDKTIATAKGWTVTA